MPFIALSTGKKTEQHIRKRFYEWFKDSGQTQKEAGAAVEWEQQTVSSYFRGEQQIDFVRAIAWCDHFGRTVDDLLTTAPKARPANNKQRRLLNSFAALNDADKDLVIGTSESMAGSRRKQAARDRSSSSARG